MAQKDFEKLKSEVFGRQKVLAEIYAKFGNFSISDYVNSWKVGKFGLDENFAELIGKSLAEIYGQDIAKKAMLQLKANSLVSTIDHHGILNHPFFINSNLIFSQRRNIEYLICFSTASISLNNSSWPGCLFITGKEGKLRRFSFFPDSQKTKSVISTPALALENKEKILKQIEKDQGLNWEQKQKISQFLNKIISPEIYKQNSFSSQASLISHRLWQEIFPKAPKLIYLPLENLVSQAIAEIICNNPGHILHKLLFTSQGWDLIEKYFQGSMGAFFGEHKGSFLFWGLDKKGRRVHLFRQELGIRNQELGIEWRLEPGTILEALKLKQIYPTSLLCFLVLLYYQITALGGFNQVNWLTNIKEKFISLLLEIGENGLAEKIKSVPTDNFAESNLAFLIKDEKLIKASGLDIFLEENGLFQRYENLAKQLTLKESLESEFPDIYRIITPTEERKDNLLSLTYASVLKFNRMEKLLKKLLT